MSARTSLLGLTPRLRHGELAHLAPEGGGRWPSSSGEVSECLSADGGGTPEPLREHRGVGKGTRYHSTAVIWMVRGHLRPDPGRDVEASGLQIERMCQ